MPKLNEYISFNSDFRESVNLYLDLNKAEKIKSYIPTKYSVEILKIYLDAVVNNKMQSTLLIGPYGKGKSHLILIIMAILSLNRTVVSNEELIVDLAKRVGMVDTEAKELILRVWSKGKFLPILIMSTQGDLNQAFMVGLNDALKREELSDIAPDTYYSYAIETIKLWRNNYKETYSNMLSLLTESKISENDLMAGLKTCNKDILNTFKKIYPQLTSGGTFNPLVNSEILPMYSNINDKLVDEYGYSGMLIVFDEISKYIESQDRKTAGSNMKLLQDICELANASKHSQLIFSMVAHKSIKEYGKYLSADIINSFTGIEGRIKEIYFVTSSKSNYELVQNAIYKVDGFEKVSCIAKRLTKDKVDDYYQLGSFSSVFTRSDFEKIVVRGCYPLSPTSTYLLLNISEKVAQNERTLFTFISKDEQYSVARHVNIYADESGDNWVVGAPLIYDYFKSLFKKDVINTFIHNIWLQAEYAISQTKDKEQIDIIKTLAIINIVNKPDEMPADRGSLLLASEVKDPDKAINGLVESGLIYKKASNNSYSFKTRATSELKSEIKKRKNIKAGRTNINAILSMVSDVHYVLPKKYNNDFKMTRYFRYEFMSVEEFLTLTQLNAVLNDGNLNDGKFVVLFSTKDTDFSVEIMRKMQKDKVKNLAVIYSSQSFKIMDQVIEYDVIQEIKKDQAYFSNDENKVLEREVPIIEEELEKVIIDFLDNTYGNLSSKVVFYFDGEQLCVTNKKSLSDIADCICYKMYDSAIRVNNELINKENITTTPIKKVRKTLIEQLLQKDNMSAYLSGTSAEATIYRALFVGTGLESDAADDNTKKVIKVINNFIDSASEGKKSLSILINNLKSAPIGMRKGIIPIFLAYVISKRNEDIVVYFDTKEVQIDAGIVLNMCENPEDFFIFTSVDNVRKEAYLKALSELFEVKENSKRTESRIHAIVVNMQRWFRSLPQITKNLKKENEYWEDERLSNSFPVFKEAMQSFDVNSYEVLFKAFPEAFGCEEDYEQLPELIRNLRKKLSEYYRWMINKTVVATLGVFDPKHTNDLTHTLIEWYDMQSDLAKHGLHSTRATNLMACISENDSFDDGDVVKKVVRAVTGMYMDTWNENSFNQYLSDLRSVKDEIEALGDESIQKLDQHKLSFTGKKGETIECYYSHIDENTGAILRNILTDTLDDFFDLTVNEKVAILLEMITKELGKKT